MIDKLKFKLKNLWLNFYLFTLGSYIRAFKKPRIPKNRDGKILLHIGCGTCHDQRYINFDTRVGLHIHYVEKIENIHRIFPPSYADLIYCCHVLEHIPYADVPDVLKKVYYCLKPNGIFRISVPNFKTMVEMYLENQRLEDILPPLMGGQGYADNFHYTAYDGAYLTDLLHKAGFTTVRTWDPKETPEYTFDDWARKIFPLYGKNWPISLNLEAVKKSRMISVKV